MAEHPLRLLAVVRRWSVALVAHVSPKPSYWDAPWGVRNAARLIAYRVAGVSRVVSNDVTPQALRRPAYGMRGTLQRQYLVTFLDGAARDFRVYPLSHGELDRELFQPPDYQAHFGVDLCR